MNGLPNINDLLKKNLKNKKDDTEKVDHPVLHIASKETEDKFNKKIANVSFVEKERETQKLATKIGFPHIDLEKFPISQEALRQLTKEQSNKEKMVCFLATPDELRFGAMDPQKESVKELIHEIEERNHASGSCYVISQKSLDRVFKLYENLPVIKPITKDIEIHTDDLAKVQADVTDFKSFQKLLDKKTASDMLTLILGVALKLDASDVHVEVEEKRVLVRIRLDGILHDAAYLPKESFGKLISRIKLVSSLKINIFDKPQDGRFTIKPPQGTVDVRVSTMPTIYGESVVMRLLNQTHEGISLDSLGLRGRAYAVLKQEIERPNGMIITTGPTSSGKTTIMYAVMQILNKPGVKIITLEDPVEYKMPGINQSQVDYSKDYTFAKGLKSILRQDPDIAMVGEIRDLETAEIAIQAALTGHLILSTIHTNSASGAIPRFMSMGTKPFLLAPALNCVIGQRLVRRICPNCLEEAEIDSHLLERLGKILGALPPEEKMKIDVNNLKFYHGRGCTNCNGLGYKGRVGIYEIFSMSKEIEEVILSNKVSEYIIEEIAVSQGLITMVQDGVLKALDKITSLEEVFRVIE